MLKRESHSCPRSRRSDRADDTNKRPKTRMHPTSHRATHEADAPSERRPDSLLAEAVRPLRGSYASHMLRSHHVLPRAARWTALEQDKRRHPSSYADSVLMRWRRVGSRPHRTVPSRRTPWSWGGAACPPAPRRSPAAAPCTESAPARLSQSGFQMFSISKIKS